MLFVWKVVRFPPPKVQKKVSFLNSANIRGGRFCMFQLFSDIGPPRVEKLKVVEKCQKVESCLRNFTKLIYMAPMFRCFRGGQGAKSRKSDLHGPYFSVFSGGQGAKSRKSIYMDLIFRCFWGSEGQKAAFFGLFRCFNDIELKRVKSLTLFPPSVMTFLRSIERSTRPALPSTCRAQIFSKIEHYSGT